MHVFSNHETRRWALRWALSLLIQGLLGSAGIAGATEPLVPLNLAQSAGASLFASHQALEFRLEIPAAGLQSLRDQPRQDVRAQVFYNGVTYSNVAIHLKGRTGSFRAVDDKPGLTLDFDQFEKNQTLEGLTKVHLDNSVEDPAYLNASLGAELFRRAGLPAARVTHAKVRLNGRSLGLYILREGFTPQFLALSFRDSTGPLYEPVPTTNGPAWRRVFGRAHGREDVLALLTEACREPELLRRKERLQQLVEMDPFLTFMALEVMLSHRDGYCLAANNYRVYQNPETGKLIFLPHGMDQLFGLSDLPLRPHFGGAVAQALMEIPEFRQSFRERANQLFTNLLKPHLTGLSRQLALSPALIKGLDLSSSEKRNITAAIEALEKRIEARLIVLARQLKEPLDPVPLEFSNRTARLTEGWRPVDVPADGRLDRQPGPSGRLCLHIQAGPATAASWRATYWLAAGHYRFEGQIRTAGVQALPNSRNKGAGLRVMGVTSRPHELTGDSSWNGLEVDFRVPEPGGVREFLCELRASAGEAWFDLESLKLIRLE